MVRGRLAWAHLATGRGHAAGGWTGFLVQAYVPRQPREPGLGRPPGKAPYGKDVRFCLFIFARRYQHKRSKKKKGNRIQEKDHIRLVNNES